MGRVCSAALVMALLPATAGSAEEWGDARAGLETARGTCAGCHAVERGNRRSIRPEAPAFAVIAATAGMSGRALAAALQRSHRAMPDIILEPRERDDVVAYILSLRGE